MLNPGLAGMAPTPPQFRNGLALHPPQGIGDLQGLERLRAASLNLRFQDEESWAE